MHEDSAAGSTGDDSLYQNFFVCLNYEIRKVQNISRSGLYIQYGIYVDSDETGHLYLSYFDTDPLDPAFYSFGSRDSDVQILNAHISVLTAEEQIKLRCPPVSDLSKATELSCDYKCHPVCDGCTRPYSIKHCKKCLYAGMRLNYTLNETIQSNLLCVAECQSGYKSVSYKDTLANVCDGKMVPQLRPLIY